MNHKTAIIDLDGTLLEYDGYKPGVFGDLKPGAREFIKDMKERGYTLVIHTARGYDDWIGIRRHLQRQGIDPETFAYIRCDKPVGMVYIDDRAVRFEGDWEGMADTVEALVERTVR